MKKLFKNFASQTGRFRLRNEVPASESTGEEGTGGLKLVTVFIAVLALHVLVIGSISAYHFFKGSPKDTVASIPAPDVDSTATASTTPADATTPDATAEKPTDASVAAAQKDGTPVDASSVAEEPIPTPAISTNPDATASAPAPALAQNTPAPTTPAPAPAAAPAPAKPVAAIAPVAVSTVYVVKKGDTMHRLAQAHGITVAQLKSQNGIKGNALHVGQKLAFRGTSTAPSAAATSVAAVSANAVSGSGKTYKVAKGDTLTHIAKTFNTSPAAIMAANKLSDPRKLKIGAVLQIPGKAGASQSAHVVPAAAPSHGQGSSLALNK